MGNTGTKKEKRKWKTQTQRKRKMEKWQGNGGMDNEIEIIMLLEINHIYMAGYIYIRTYKRYGNVSF